MAGSVRHADGEAIDYTPVSAVTTGDTIDLGDFVGIAEHDIPAGATGSLAIEGIFRVPKKTGETWAVGETAYYDVGTTSYSHTSSYSEAVAGVIVAVAVSGDSTGLVKLTPGVVRA